MTYANSPSDRPSDWWQTSISDIAPDRIRLRGYAIERLIGNVTLPEMMWLMLRGDLPTKAEASLLERAMVAAVDHGPQAPSIAAARMAATCGVGINVAMATGINTLGDVHGGAGQQCMEMLVRVRDRVRDAGEAISSAVADEIASHRSARVYVPGFGHRFHQHDPRRDPLLEAVRSHVAAHKGDGLFIEIAVEFETQLARSCRVPMNVDGATAVIYSELGFAPELGRGLFVLSRSIGVLAHAWEETRTDTRLKGPMPPSLLPAYTGPSKRDVPARAKRDAEANR